MGIRKIIKETLLVEGRLEDVIKKYATPEHDPDVPEEFILYLSENDPSGNNKYLEWMVKIFYNYLKGWDLDGDTEYKAINNLLEIVKTFHKIQDRITPDRAREVYNYIVVNMIGGVSHFTKNFTVNPKDINNYLSANSLKFLCDKIKEWYPSDSEIKKGTEILYEDDNVLIISPKNVASSCKYGSGTKWCTAATKSRNRFTEYTRSGQGLIYFIFKNSKNDGYKLALHWNHTSKTYYNPEDLQVNGFEYLNYSLQKEGWFSKFKTKKYVNKIMDIVNQYISNQYQ